MAAIEYKANLWGMVGLQGQKISALGNTLGNCNRQVVDTPYRGKRVNKFIKLLPFQGEFFFRTINPGRCPGLIARWPYRPPEYKCTCETSGNNTYIHETFSFYSLTP